MATARNGMTPETESLIAECSLYPGFKFTPTDKELICFYLKRKIDGSDAKAQIIPEIDLCKFEPWDLPALSVMKSDSEWFFFSSRGRRYQKGSQSKRATESGYWKATGRERSLKSGSCFIGKKRTLVFHMGRAPKGVRTEWIIHEYSTPTQSQDSLVVFRLKKNLDFHSYHKAKPKNSANQKSASDYSSEQIVPVDKGLEDCSKNCSAIFESYSFLQIDSTSDNPKQNLNSDCSVVEYSGGQKDDDYYDCFAEIMNDDILILGESSSLPDLPPSISGFPSQGTANRRMRLRIGATHFENPKDQNMGAAMQRRGSVFSVRNHQMCVIWSILTLLFLLLVLSQVKLKIFLCDGNLC